MAFKQTTNPIFKTLVTVLVPNDKGGHDKSTFTAHFKRPTSAERTELIPLVHEDLVRKQLVGWDMKDEDTRQDVPFTDDTLDAVLQIWPTPLATAQAFWEGINGARAKN